MNSSNERRPSPQPPSPGLVDDRLGGILKALPCVRIDASDEDNVAVIALGVRDLGLLIPGQKTFRTHIMIGQGEAEARGAVVRQRAVQRVSVKEHDAAARDLDRHGVGIGKRSVIGLKNAVERRVVMREGNEKSSKSRLGDEATQTALLLSLPRRDRNKICLFCSVPASSRNNR